MSKLAKVLAAMDAGDWRKAIGIASKFGELGAQRDDILRAQSAYQSPDFYSQLGHDPEAIIEAGKAALRERIDRMRAPTN